MVCAPGNDALGSVDVIHHGYLHAHELGDGNTRQVAHVPRREHIGGAEQIGDAVNKVVKVPPRAMSEHNRFRAGFRLELIHPVGQQGQGFVPGDTFPSALAPGADPLLRV